MYDQNCLHIAFLILFECNAKSFAINCLFFLLFLILLSVFGKTAESLLANVLTLVIKDS